MVELQALRQPHEHLVCLVGEFAQESWVKPQKINEIAKCKKLFKSNTKNLKTQNSQKTQSKTHVFLTVGNSDMPSSNFKHNLILETRAAKNLKN